MNYDSAFSFVFIYDVSITRRSTLAMRISRIESLSFKLCHSFNDISLEY